ncbi:MAG: colanic acid/amylovoran biosynthesis glycosyltransferase [Ulvibacter sp.]
MQNKKIKILHLFNSYLPETENWSYNLIQNLLDTEIHIGAKNYLKKNFYNSRFHFIDNYFDELNKMNRQLGKRKPSDILKKLAIKTIPFIFGKVDQLFIDYGRKTKVELIHAHFADIGWEFRRVAQRLKVPLVISFYGWDYEKLPYTKSVYRERFEKLFEIADGFICEGVHGAAILKKYGCPEEKIFVVHLGVQPKEIPIIKREKLPNSLKLVQIASFTEKKGHQYAIEALAKIVKECPNIELTFIGNDNEPMRREKLEQQVEAFNLKDKIRFLPPVDYKNLYRTLADYDVFIHPSCYAADRDCEGGAPVVLLDAQATGMPVIATTHCDIPDEVIHNKTGFLSQEKNVEELVEHIKKFYKMDNTLFQIFANQARNHIEQNYNIKTSAIQLLKIYNKIYDKYNYKNIL